MKKILISSLLMGYYIVKISQIIYYPPKKQTKQYTIDENVKNIYFNTFENCVYLEHITIPEGVIYAGFQNFIGCINLKVVTIPKSLNSSICEWFFECDNLETIIYKGTAEEWYQLGGRNDYRVKCIDTEILPYIQNINYTQKGQTEIDDTSNESKPYYKNTVSNNSTISGDYIIRNSYVTVNEGKTLNVTGKIIIESGSLYIENGATASANGIELKSGGALTVSGQFTSNGAIIVNGGNNSENGGKINIYQKGEVFAGDISLYDYAEISMYGKLHANNFLIQTKSNFSNLGSTGELWLNGNFTQKKNGALWWQSGQDNFCPSNGFTVILEETGREHNISFDTPEQSYLYNLYTVTNSGSANTWTGNPTIKGNQYNVTKNSLGYSINKGNKASAKNVVKNFKDEMNSILNGTSYTSIAYGISEFGGMNSETNVALKKYLCAYIAGIDALYPSLIDVSAHTWYEKIPVKYDGWDRDVKFSFTVVNWMGSKVVNVNYTYKNSTNKQCFTFFTTNKNELANTIRKYATDTYSSAIADYFSMPVNKYVQNKKSVFANLLWDGIQNVGVVGTGSGKKTLKSFIKKGVNKYLDKIEDTISTSSYSADFPVTLSLADEASKDYGIALLSDMDVEQGVDDTGFSDSYLVSTIKEELGLDESAELTREVLESIEELNLTSSYITDLSGIEQCVNLKNLNLSGNAVSDLTKLSTLKKLEILDLSGNSVSELSALSGLTSLQKLVVKNNLLTDLTGLESLTNIVNLDLSFNEITSISPLSGLTNLQSLNLTDNAISDITPLTQCTDLKILYLGANIISDITPIKNIALEKLNISKNNITSIDNLSVTELTALDISENSIPDISILSSATKMTDLNIGGNSISYLGAVSAMSSLTKLNLGDNNIADITDLSSLTDLTELNCANNFITEFEPITKLVNLTRLDISNNEVDDFSFTASLTNLQRLAASGCNLYSIDIENIPSNVAKLDLSCNSITDISTFIGMQNLTELNLANNYITDISGFADITRDMTLNINGNDISNEQVNALYETMNDSQYYIRITNDIPDVALEDIYFVKDGVFVEIGKEYIQEISVMPYNANAGDLIWKSADNNVAEVNNGIVIGKNVGQTIISVSTQDGEFYADYTVTVTENMIHDVEISGNTVFATLENVSDEDYDSVTVVIAIYNGNRFCDTKTINVENFVSGYYDNIQEEFDEISDGSYAKVFLWYDLDGIQPITSTAKSNNL